MDLEMCVLKVSSWQLVLIHSRVFIQPPCDQLPSSSRFSTSPLIPRDRRVRARARATNSLSSFRKACYFSHKIFSCLVFCGIILGWEGTMRCFLACPLWSCWQRLWTSWCQPRLRSQVLSLWHFSVPLMLALQDRVWPWFSSGGALHFKDNGITRTLTKKEGEITNKSLCSRSMTR